MSESYTINKDVVSMKTFNEYIDMSMEINKLQEQLKSLISALEDCAAYSRCDDVNGEAGYIAEKALKKYEETK